MNRTILHSDLNNFYASVECLYNPDIRKKPVAVCGDVEQRHGIVLAKNSLAKSFGVQTGEPLWMAKQKCPEVVFVPPHYDRYLSYSQMARELYQEYTDQVEPFGLDECWLDVSQSCSIYGSGTQIAGSIRRRIKKELGVTASIGVSFNKVLAKLGSDLKKPDATTEITKENLQNNIWPLPVENLLYVGHATRKKLSRYAIHTIGQLAQADTGFLEYTFGKIGLMLWGFANGLEDLPVANQKAVPKMKSVGNSTTAPRDLISGDDVKITLLALCESVSERLRDHGFYARTVQISIRDNSLCSYERQKKLPFPACTTQILFEQAFLLYQRQCEKKPIRSIGIKACDLIIEGEMQLSLYAEAARHQRQELLEHSIDSVRRRFGHFAIQRGIMLTDRELSQLDAKGEHIIYPVSFLR